MLKQARTDKANAEAEQLATNVYCSFWTAQLRLLEIALTEEGRIDLQCTRTHRACSLAIQGGKARLILEHCVPFAI